jgi:hypothetical protein
MLSASSLLPPPSFPPQHYIHPGLENLQLSSFLANYYFAEISKDGSKKEQTL